MKLTNEQLELLARHARRGAAAHIVDVSTSTKSYIEDIEAVSDDAVECRKLVDEIETYLDNK